MGSVRSASDVRLRLRVWLSWAPYRLRYRQWRALRQHFTRVFWEAD